MEKQPFFHLTVFEIVTVFGCALKVTKNEQI